MEAAEVPAVGVSLAVIDNEVLTHAKRTADERIKLEARLAEERHALEKQIIKQRGEEMHRAKLELLRLEQERAREQAKREKAREEQAAAEAHVAWRALHPHLAAEEDELRRVEHAQKVEEISARAALESEAHDREVEAREWRLHKMCMIALGAVVGGVAGSYM